MNGAEALIKTLEDCGVDVCFANPGTSEMQLVAALDGQSRMRAILGLFEGVVTGAADGYARMAEKPAATLLHLGPGLGNGLANLHNAKRARSPIINIVGDHAVDHLQYDAPLTSDLIGVAKPMSDWVRVSSSASDLALAGSQAYAQATTSPGRIATIIVPADHAWTKGAESATIRHPPATPKSTDKQIKDAAEALIGSEAPVLFLGGKAMREDALTDAGRIAAVTGARLVSETFSARIERGAGRVAPERLPYFGEKAAEFLAGTKQMIIAGSIPPVSFFSYPGMPSWLSPADAELINLATPEQDVADSLHRLAVTLDAPAEPASIQPASVPSIETGPLTTASAGSVIANLIPENAIVSDEGTTAGLAIYPMTKGACKHDWLMLTGGSIGQGLPVATGAAIACPDRKILALQADGSAMYTVQSLWTMAREGLDITTVILNNGSYAILNIELDRVGIVDPGPKALSLLDLTNPVIDWVSISEGMGVPAVRAETCEELYSAMSDALAIKGPRLVEAIITG